MSPDWMTDAECRGVDPDIFFAEKGASKGGNGPAKAICAVCPVRAHCLDYAIAKRIKIGVWGGMTVGERQRIARTRRRAA